MDNLTIKHFDHHARCEFYRCNNMAVHSIGEDNHPAGVKFNICDDCLQRIVNAVPIAMIKTRPDIAEVRVVAPIIKAVEQLKSTLSVEEIPKIPDLPFTEEPKEPTEEEIKKELPTDYNLLTYVKELEDMTMSEIIEKGKEYGIKFKPGMKKTLLIKMIKEAQNG